MTALQIFAFFILPVAVTVVLVTGALFITRADRKRERLHPGE